MDSLGTMSNACHSGSFSASRASISAALSSSGRGARKPRIHLSLPGLPDFVFVRTRSL